MKDRIRQLLARRRTSKDWAVLAILAVSAIVEMLDAGAGLQSIAHHQHIAADSIIDLADIFVGVTAAILIRL